MWTGDKPDRRHAGPDQQAQRRLRHLLSGDERGKGLYCARATMPREFIWGDLPILLKTTIMKKKVFNLDGYDKNNMSCTRKKYLDILMLDMQYKQKDFL